jgi:hypothetical protein
MDGVVQNFKVKTAGFYPHTSKSLMEIESY